MRIRIDFEKLRKRALGRVTILLFFLIGIFFTGIRPMVRISHLRDKVLGLERGREEQLGKLETGEKKIEKIQGEIEALGKKRLSHEKEEERGRREFQNLSVMKGVVASLIRKNGIEIESIGRSALREIKGESYLGKRYEAVVPYSVRGGERGIKKLFADFHGRGEELGLKSTPLEVRYLEAPQDHISREELREDSFKGDGIDWKRIGRDRKIEVKFRTVGIVGEIRESDELDEIENLMGREGDYSFRSRVVERGYITVSGREYEVVTLDDGSKSMRRVRGKSLEKTH